MTQSTRSARHSKPTKPEKPYDGFPLFPHASGRWAKKIKGKLRYFGRWDRSADGSGDWQAALDRYEREADDLHAGRTPKRARKSASGSDGRPEKPRPDYPLFAHRNGSWAKKIRGKLYYFGPWSDPEGAEARYKRELPYRREGRTPPPAGTDGTVTVAALIDLYLNAKRRKLESGELAQRTFQENYEACQLVAKEFGKDRPVDDLRPDDFAKLRSKLAKRWGPVRVGKFIGLVKAVFKFALENNHIAQPVQYGSEFQKPGKATLRRHRAEGGKKLFTADEVRRLLAEVSMPLRSMILLGINGGLGNTDLADLQKRHLDLDGGWLNYPRGKTGIERRIPLWPETMESLREAIAKRPEPKDKADAGCVFLTSQRHRWVRATEKSRSDTVAIQFGKLLRKLDINGRRGLGFYSLRSTFATIGLQAGDRDAVKAIMGHTEGDMLATYDQTGPGDERLRAVADTVHRWLFSE